MFVMVSALSDVVAGTTGVKREREENDEIQPRVRPTGTPPFSLPPAMDFNLDPPWPLQLSYPSVQHHYHGAHVPMSAPPTATMMPPPLAFLEMDSILKLQRLSSQNRNGSQKTLHIDVGEDGVKIKNEEKPKTEINLVNFSSEDPVKKDEGKSSEQPISLRSRLMKMFKRPTKGENYTISQALVSVDRIILFVATTCVVGTTINAIDNVGQIGKALGYTTVNIRTFVSLISIWNFLGRVAEALFSEFLLQKYKFPRLLIFTIVLLIACLQNVFTAFPLPGSLYVASAGLGLSFRTRWPKSLRSCLVNGLHINSNWRQRENKGKGQYKVMKHLPYCGYMDLKKASFMARKVAVGLWFVVFICFLIMCPSEGTFMRGACTETQSAQTISDSNFNKYVPVVHSGHSASEKVLHSAVTVFNVEKYGARGDEKHSTERTAATMDRVLKVRKLSEPSKPKLDPGQGAQHN
ncbi:hypothetical protein SUGI_0481630 [Cryptomeria japonica]|uniref:uncharacterized protein LOC131030171 n=1 Tax=Cryptomeria japonica TaxID=3369 RepID=UPI002408ABF6|nr:uncharacterized protein LOC131030171 [Cryptomeria japonica]GLJ25181.1 hypothetical protein SUGI_0481630 [Cryptomeria japonica]